MKKLSKQLGSRGGHNLIRPIIVQVVDFAVDNGAHKEWRNQNNQVELWLLHS